MRLNLSKYEHCVKKLERLLQPQNSWGTGVLLYKQIGDAVSNINFTIVNKKQSTNIPALNIENQKQLDKWIDSFNLNQLVIIKDDLINN